MFSRIKGSRTSAWRLALRSTLVFAVGSAGVFLAMYLIVARVVEARSDAWLMAESETLRQVALSTPRDALYDRTVEEVAELASQEGSYGGSGHPDNTVFFAETDDAGHALVWVGPPDSGEFLEALRDVSPTHAEPVSLRMRGWRGPFRVVAVQMKPGGGRVYLGLRDAAGAALLRRLLLWFGLGWMCMVAFGFLVTLLGLRRMLQRVDAITGTAASIRSDDLSTRVPVEKQRDEVARLARTFNNMLDRISSTVNQLRTLTDSMAHDLKSPITSVRGRLELALSLEDRVQSAELVAGAIEQLDRLSEVITMSLDLAEADGGALRLRVAQVDVGELVGRVTELYAPAFAENGQTLTVRGGPEAPAELDVSLCSRMLSNLMENELRYGGAGVVVKVSSSEGLASITVEDDGAGFSSELLLEAGSENGAAGVGAGLPRVFQRFVKGRQSKGHGLGLAFVNAVAVAHGGRAMARNRAGGGAEIVVELPLASAGVVERDASGAAVG
ncbi:MAG TPA: HAMP domain-containing sensor histidine kinase [Acidobacteriaceae bacterium]|jgi:signal transduction histidine kinase|nr:HAMP domain-containing sensor histidine kinase [Acidobacteriaceae bacterium]